MQVVTHDKMTSVRSTKKSKLSHKCNEGELETIYSTPSLARLRGHIPIRTFLELLHTCTNDSLSVTPTNTPAHCSNVKTTTTLKQKECHKLKQQFAVSGLL